MFFALALLACPKSAPPVAEPPDPELAKPLPVDPEVRMGV